MAKNSWFGPDKYDKRASNKAVDRRIRKNTKRAKQADAKLAKKLARLDILSRQGVKRV